MQICGISSGLHLADGMLMQALSPLSLVGRYGVEPGQRVRSACEAVAAKGLKDICILAAREHERTTVGKQYRAQHAVGAAS